MSEPKVSSNAPKPDFTDTTAAELERDLGQGLEQADEKIRREQRHFPDSRLSSNAPKPDRMNADLDVEDAQERLEEHLEEWDGRQAKNAPRMPLGEITSNAPRITNREGDVSEDTEGYQERIEERLEEMDEKTRRELRENR